MKNKGTFGSHDEIESHQQWVIIFSSTVCLCFSDLLWEEMLYIWLITWKYVATYMAKPEAWNVSSGLDYP